MGRVEQGHNANAQVGMFLKVPIIWIGLPVDLVCRMCLTVCSGLNWFYETIKKERLALTKVWNSFVKKMRKAQKFMYVAIVHLCNLNVNIYFEQIFIEIL